MPPLHLDQLRRQDGLLIIILALLGIGLLMVQSASMRVTGETGWFWSERASRHAVYVLLAIGALIIGSRIDYRTLLGRGGDWKRSPAVWGMFVAVAACLLVLVPGVGKEVNGARRWIVFGPAQLQPSEVAKWGTVAYLAWWLVRRPIPLETFKGFLVCVAPIGMACALVAKEDFGTAALIGGCAFLMLIVGGVRWLHLLVTLPPVLAAGAWLVLGTPYRWQRMTSFLDPWADPRGEGYHMVQSLLSFATGGPSGTGLGAGIQKLGYLPEDTTDFIFAVVCEELGFFGAALVVALYLSLLVIAWRTARDAKHESTGRLFVFGVCSMVALQAIINIAVVTVSVPTKGLSLPLISAGGSGLILTCGALGLCHSVIRRKTAAHRQATSTEDARVYRDVTDRDWQAWTKAA